MRFSSILICLAFIAGSPTGFWRLRSCVLTMPPRNHLIRRSFPRYNANNITGLSVGIIYGGELIYAKGYGIKNLDLDPFTHNTKSLLASVSKTITGVMAMKNGRKWRYRFG